MCCMAELENILLREHDAELCLLPESPAQARNATIVCVLLAFYQLPPLETQLRALREAGNRVVVYLFDCWDTPHRLYSRGQQFIERLPGLARAIASRLRPAFSLEDSVDRLCLPFRPVYESLRPEHRAIARHVPLATDTTLVNGLNSDRPIAVLAYGRQLPGITRTVAEAMNTPESPYIFHHTDHLSIGAIDDMRLHRMHFWKLAQSSLIALAYDPHITSPMRVPMSIVGQRWFESLAAGCIVAGSRPSTEEADELLDWPEATIELPEAPEEALAMLHALCAEPQKLATIRERNVEHVRTRHDWRHRLSTILD